MNGNTPWSEGSIARPDPHSAGRWLVCTRNQWGWETATESHLCEASARREQRKLQAEYDREANRKPEPPADPHQPRQIVLGFYTDDDAK